MEFLNTTEEAIFQQSINGFDEMLPECLPCFTPDEMIALGVFETDNVNDNYYKVESTRESIDWFEEYQSTGNPGINWYNKVSNIYREFVLDKSNKNKQRLLEAGWNPEVDFTLSSVKSASKFTREKLNESYSISIVNLTDDYCINESLVDSAEDELNIYADMAYDIYKELKEQEEYKWAIHIFSTVRHIDDNGALVFLEFDKKYSKAEDYDYDEFITLLIQTINSKFLEKNILQYKVEEINNISDKGELKIIQIVQSGDLGYTTNY